jgi:hypothetical protein
LAGRQAETEGNVGLAGPTVAERDEVLTARDVIAAGQLQDQRFVERRDDLEVEAVEAFDHGEVRRLDPPLDRARLAVDQFELGEPQQVTDVIDALGGALPGVEDDAVANHLLLQDQRTGLTSSAMSERVISAPTPSVSISPPDNARRSARLVPSTSALTNRSP